MGTKRRENAIRRIIALMLTAVLIVAYLPAQAVFAAELPKTTETVDAALTVAPVISGDGQILKSISFGGRTYNVTRDDNMAWQVLEIMNKERAKYGLKKLTMDKRLMDVAMGRAAEITVKFDHIRPDGSSCFTAYPMASKENGWNGLFACGENIAAGQSTASSVMDCWMNSSGHRKNILNETYKSVGIGCVKMNGGYYIYWAQCFGDRVIEEAFNGSLKVDGLDYSVVFDADYYLSHYADLKKAFGSDKNKAFQHFLKYGMKEGRQGNSTFNVISYKNNYADLRKAFGNDLVKYYQHYIKNGKREGRVCIDYSAVFNAAYYANKYSDLKAAFGNDQDKLFRHFLNNGMREGRQASAGFDVKAYKNRYQDLRLAFGNDLPKYYLHYVKNGKREGRSATNCSTVQNPVTKLNGVDYSAVYDFNTYQAKNPDVKKAFGNDDIATLNHFIKNGMRERRQAKADFNVYQYIVNYKDLRQTYKYDYASYYLHFIRNGKREKRSASGNATYSQAKAAIDKTLSGK